MKYDELLKLFGVHLFPHSVFTPCDLANGWEWWNAQSFSREGYCRQKETGEFFRLTMATEARGKLIYAIYTIGPSLGFEHPPTKP